MVLDEFILKLNVLADTSGISKLIDQFKVVEKSAVQTNQVIDKSNEELLKNFEKKSKESAYLIDKLVKGSQGLTKGSIDEFQNALDGIAKKLGGNVELAVNKLTDSFSILKSIMNFKEVFASLRLLIGPLGLIALAVMAVFLLIQDLMTYLDGGQSVMGETWAPFIESAKLAKNILFELVNAFKDWWAESGEDVKKNLGFILELFQYIFGLIGFILMEVLVFLNDNIETVKVLFMSVLDVILGVFEFIAGFCKVLVAALTGDWEGFVEGLEGMWSGLKHFIFGVLGAIGAAMALLGEAFYAAFESAIDWIFDIFFGFQTDLQILWTEIGESPKDALAAMERFVQSTVDRIFKLFAPLKNLISSVWSGFSSIATAENTPNAYLENKYGPGTFSQNQKKQSVKNYVTVNTSGANTSIDLINHFTGGSFNAQSSLAG